MADFTEDSIQTEQDLAQPDPELGGDAALPGAAPALPAPADVPNETPGAPGAEPTRRARSPNAGHWYALPGIAAPAGDSEDVHRTAGPRRSRTRQTTRDRVRRRKLKRMSGAPDDWAWVTIASALVGVTAVMTMMIFFLYRAANSTGSTTATSIPGVEPTSMFYTGEGGLLGDQSMVIQPWSGSERFTVLVMGMDKRPGETGFAYLTDTIMIVSLDPQKQRIGVLSVPRDLQVEVPDFGVQPINTVYRLGELDGPGGGSLLAMTTVQYNLGIPVNEYVVVDFETFITLIDLIGGVQINVEQTIDDPEYPDMNYGYDPFYLDAGWQHLDGTTALKFARSRHQTDDIDRAHRQQQLLYAVRDKVVSAQMLPELAAKAYPLWAELRDGIDTGLDIDQILELAWYAKDVPRNNIVTGVIGWDYIVAENWNGRPIIRPNRERLGTLMEQVFGPDYNQQP